MKTYKVQQWKDGNQLGAELSVVAEEAKAAAERVCGETLVEDQGTAGVLRAQVTLVEGGRVSKRMFYSLPEKR